MLSARVIGFCYAVDNHSSDYFVGLPNFTVSYNWTVTAVFCVF